MAYTLTDERRRKYQQRWDDLRISNGVLSQVTSVANKILKNKSIYENISKLTGGSIPWEFIGLVHYRESNCNFTRHLHEGSPLTSRTRYVPKGRPVAPPKNTVAYTFEESAIDALRMKNLHKVTDWSIPNLSYLLEGYNGYGYAYKGIPSPYLYGGSNQYTKGKYIADHVFDPEHVDKQLGCLTILKRIQALDGQKGDLAIATGGIATTGAAVAATAGIAWYWVALGVVLVLVSGVLIYAYVKGNKIYGKEVQEVKEEVKGTASEEKVVKTTDK